MNIFVKINTEWIAALKRGISPRACGVRSWRCRWRDRCHVTPPRLRGRRPPVNVVTMSDKGEMSCTWRHNCAFQCYDQQYICIHAIFLSARFWAKDFKNIKTSLVNVHIQENQVLSNCKVKVAWKCLKFSLLTITSSDYSIPIIFLLEKCSVLYKAQQHAKSKIM